jgi:acyl-CoA thioester hydrolase
MGRTELERLLDLEVRTQESLGVVFPIIESYCRHLCAIRFDDRIRVRAWVAGADRLLTVGYEILNDTTGRRAAEGYTVQVALKADTFELQLEIPDEILDRVRRVLGAAPGLRPVRG